MHINIAINLFVYGNEWGAMYAKSIRLYECEKPFFMNFKKMYKNT